MLHPAHDLRAGYLTAAVVVLIWTGFIIVSRLGGISTLTSYDIIALRYMVACILLFPFWVRHRHNLWDRRKFVLALSGALIYALFIFAGFRHAPANHAGILLPGFMPFAITVIAWLVLREIPSRHRMMGLAVIALGVGCIAIETFSHSGFSFVGDALLLAGSCCWGVYTVFLRKWALPPLETTITVTLIAGALYLPVYALFLPKGIAITPWQDIALQGFYQGIMAAIVQMILYARAVSLLGPTRMGLMMAFIPVTVGFAAIPALGEPLTPLVILGLVFVCMGAWLGNRSAKLPPAPTL
jgi:drug/metabolite transporter (DMT)-like permease